MTPGARRGALLRLAARAYPPAFRRRHGDALVALAEDLCVRRRRRLLPSLVELLVQGLAQRWLRRPIIPARQDRSSTVDRSLQDIGFALRGLRRRPGFALVVVSTLAIGIGANTAIFAVLDGLLLTPLPIPHAERVYRMYDVNLERGSDGSNVSLPNFEDLAARAGVIEAAGAFTRIDRSLVLGEYPERVRALATTSGLYAIAGIRPLLGRLPTAAEEDVGAEPVAVVTEGFWRDRMAADPDAVGSALRLDGRPHTLVGVVTAVPIVPGAQILLPLPRNELVSAREQRFLDGIVRLAPGVEPGQADEQLGAVAAGLTRAYPDVNDGWSVRLEPLQASLVDDTWQPFALLLGAVTTVLLIACVNVANLLLARAADREREVSVRAALGAGRGRIVRQMLTESLVLSLGAGLVGLAASGPAVGFLRARLPGDVVGVAPIALDPGILLFALLLSLVTGIGFGIVPAMRAARLDLLRGLRADSGGNERGRSGAVRDGLVVLQVALAVVLVGVAGILLSALGKATGVSLGFEPDEVLVMRLDPPADRYPSGRLLPFLQELAAEAERLPGVAAAAITSQIPMDSSRTARGLKLPEEAPPPIEEAIWSGWVTVSPGYFETVRPRMVSGRGFRADDDASAPPVMIITRSTARRFFGDQEALGRALHVWSDEAEPRTIVGIVEDIVDRPLSSAVGPQYFTPLAQAPNRRVNLMVRLRPGAAAPLPALRDTLKRLDPELPIFDIRPLETVVGDATAFVATISGLLSAFAGLALVLAAIGLYGVVAWAVASRTREIGVRLALGADARRVRRMVVRRSVALTVAGLLPGIWLATLASGVISDELPIADAVPWGAVVGLLLVAAAAASWLPARRATRIDPALALRAD